jgi:hypothetical protein
MERTEDTRIPKKKLYFVPEMDEKLEDQREDGPKSIVLILVTRRNGFTFRQCVV